MTRSAEDLALLTLRAHVVELKLAGVQRALARLRLGVAADLELAEAVRELDAATYRLIDATTPNPALYQPAST